MMQVRFSWKGKCPRHPRFRGTQGKYAIRQNCAACAALVEMAEAAARLEQARDRAENRIGEAEAFQAEYERRKHTPGALRFA